MSKVAGFISIDDETAQKIREMQLDDQIKTASLHLSFLLELKAKRNPEVHQAIDWAGDEPNITTVICLCGEETHYRVPLKTLDDFECPKKGK